MPPLKKVYMNEWHWLNFENGSCTVRLLNISISCSTFDKKPIHNIKVNIPTVKALTVSGNTLNKTCNDPRINCDSVLNVAW